MHTRQISEHLSNYARFLYSESDRLGAIGAVVDDGFTSVNANRLKRLGDEVMDMANQLYNMKKEIV